MRVEGKYYGLDNRSYGDVREYEYYCVDVDGVTYKLWIDWSCPLVRPFPCLGNPPEMDNWYNTQLNDFQKNDILRSIIRYERLNRSLARIDIIKSLLNAPFGGARRKAAFEAAFRRTLKGVKDRRIGDGVSAASVDAALRKEMSRYNKLVLYLK